MPTFLGAERTLWLDDSSAIVVTTRDRNYYVDKSGKWIEDELPDYLRIPSPNNPLSFGEDPAPFIANLGVPLEAIRSWGLVGAEARYSLIPLQGDWGGVAPVAAPAIELAPFGPDQLLVEGTGGCLNIHAQPDDAAEIIACLPDGSFVSIQPIPLDQITTGPHSAVEDWPLYSAYWRPAETCSGGGHWCLWASVQTPSSVQGWAFAKHLRWPSIQPRNEQPAAPCQSRYSNRHIRAHVDAIRSFAPPARPAPIPADTKTRRTLDSHFAAMPSPELPPANPNPRTSTGPSLPSIGRLPGHNRPPGNARTSLAPRSRDKSIHLFNKSLCSSGPKW